MSILFRTTALSATGLVLAATLAAPGAAQEVRRPVPHGAGAPHAVAPHGGAAPRAPGAPHGLVQAQQSRRGGNGAGVAAGVIGGLAAGAILGGILGNGARAAGPVPGGCPLVRRPVYDGAGAFAGYQDVPSC